VTVSLPASARFALWFSAWTAGTASLDEARDGIVGGDTAHDVVGLPDRPDAVPLILALGLLRAEGGRHAGLALPVPGDLLGLAGPAGFNVEVVDVGEAVVVEGAGLGLVPHRAGAGVVWQALPADRRPLDDLGEGDRSLRAALSEAADLLAALDVARWRPEVADELMNLRHRTTYLAPAGTPPRAVELAGRALQALEIVALATQDHGGAVTALEMMRREDALRPLDGAARRALVAACSPEVWPPA